MNLKTPPGVSKNNVLTLRRERRRKAAAEKGSDKVEDHYHQQFLTLRTLAATQSFGSWEVLTVA